jgi:hypothetical protein
VAFAIGDCHIDANDGECAAGESRAIFIVLLTSFSTIATFFLVR